MSKRFEKKQPEKKEIKKTEGIIDTVKKIGGAAVVVVGVGFTIVKGLVKK